MVQNELKNPALRKMKIDELARICGLGIETPRFYERRGLLDRCKRRASGYRLFEPEAIERLEFIRNARALVFSLVEIRDLIEQKRRGENPCRKLREIICDGIDQVNIQMN